MCQLRGWGGGPGLDSVRGEKAVTENGVSLDYAKSLS